jgi:uncharacterized protein HemY
MQREFTLQNASKPAPEFRTLSRQAASRARNAAMIEDLGWIEAKDGTWASATTHFQQARSMYTSRDDILRMVVAEADSWGRQGKPKKALDVIRSVLRIVSDDATAALLRQKEQEFGGGPPPAPAVPATRK